MSDCAASGSPTVWALIHVFGHKTGRRTRVAVAAAALSALCSFTVAASASAEGSFVIADQQASIGSHVTFWGAKWWKLNSPTGGTAPAAFKGFANTLVSPSACGGAWTTDPGNSSDPPEGPLAPFIDVLVTGTVTKNGRLISGDTTAVVAVATEPGYAPDPGHAGTGTVVSVVCRAGGNPGGEEGGAG